MAEAPSDETRRYSRSGFLKRTGAGVGALALTSGVPAAVLAPGGAELDGLDQTDDLRADLRQAAAVRPRDRRGQGRAPGPRRQGRPT